MQTTWNTTALFFSLAPKIDFLKLLYISQNYIFKCTALSENVYQVGAISDKFLHSVPTAKLNSSHTIYKYEKVIILWHIFTYLQLKIFTSSSRFNISKKKYGTLVACMVIGHSV